MRIKPVITNRLATRHTSYEVIFDIKQNVTFIAGDSGVGKSAVFYFFQELAAEDKNIKCYNYLDLKKGYKNSLKQSRGKLFIIDNADILLDDSLRQYIARDMNNQYIIIGRNPFGLLLGADEIFELKSEKVEGITKFTLAKSFF